MNDKQKHDFIKNGLRRMSYKWPARSKVKYTARLRRGVYLCNICKQESAAKDIQLDHILPVIDPKDGFVDWNTYIDRLLVDETGFQVLCSLCHTDKTNKENSGRRVKKKRLTKKRKSNNI